MNDENLLSMRDACKYLHVTPSTLRLWEQAGIISPARTIGGHRRYTKQELDATFKKPKPEPAKRITLAYCRVSTADQKEDLERQINVVSRYCEAKGYQYRIIKDIGSGINYSKKGLMELVSAVCTGEACRVVVNYKDRLLRFGYELLEQVCSLHNVEIEIINLTDDVSQEDELVQDVLSIITVFSARLYGHRSHKNKCIVEENKRLFSKKGGSNDKS